MSVYHVYLLILLRKILWDMCILAVWRICFFNLKLYYSKLGKES